MRKFVLAVLVTLATASLVSAQQKVVADKLAAGNGGPSGPCSVGSGGLSQSPGTDSFVDWLTGTHYVCISPGGGPTTQGTWQKAKGYSAGGSGITYTGATLNSLPKAIDTSGNLGTSLFLDDGSGQVMGVRDLTAVAVLDEDGEVDIVASKEGTSKSIYLITDTNQIEMDGINHIINISASNQINLDSRGGLVTIGDKYGAINGTALVVNDPDGAITANTAASTYLGTPTLPFFSLTVGSGPDATTTFRSDATANRIQRSPDRALTVTGNAAQAIALTAQAASIGSTAIQVNAGKAPAGLYRLTYYLVTTTAGTSGTVSVTFGFTDLGAARTSASSNVTFGTLASPASGSIIIQSTGAVDITYLTTVTSALGSPRYALNVTLEPLQ